MEECIRCHKEFEDINLKEFGNEFSKRIYCNKCVDKLREKQL